MSSAGGGISIRYVVDADTRQADEKVNALQGKIDETETKKEAVVKQGKEDLSNLEIQADQTMEKVKEKSLFTMYFVRNQANRMWYLVGELTGLSRNQYAKIFMGMFNMIAHLQQTTAHAIAIYTASPDPVTKFFAGMLVGEGVALAMFNANAIQQQFNIDQSMSMAGNIMFGRDF